MNKQVIVALAFLVPMVLTATVTVNLDGFYNSDSAAVQVGDNLLIQMTTNPSTGFCWTQNATVNSVLTLLSTNYTTPNPQLIGSSSIETLTYKVIAPGTVTLDFIYARPWDLPSIIGGGNGQSLI